MPTKSPDALWFPPAVPREFYRITVSLREETDNALTTNYKNIYNGHTKLLESLSNDDGGGNDNASKQ